MNINVGIMEHAGKVSAIMFQMFKVFLKRSALRFLKILFLWIF